MDEGFLSCAGIREGHCNESVRILCDDLPFPHMLNYLLWSLNIAGENDKQKLNLKMC